DTVAYTVTFTNTGTATAFDAHLVDWLPADLLLTQSSVTVTAAGSTWAFWSLTNVGFDLHLNQVTMGEQVTVAFNATLQQTATPNEVIANTATLTYGSLPGGTGTAPNPTGSATPGTPGSATGERDGSGTISTDTYRAMAAATVNVPNVSIAKALTAT